MCWLTVLLCVTTHAAAESADARSLAEALFAEGRRLKDAGECKAANQKFAASERLDPAVGTLLNLAECSATLGLLATAWSYYKEAAALAAARNDHGRGKLAIARARALEPKLAKLMVSVPPEMAQKAELTIELDAVVMDPATWGVELPIDAGSHTIRVAARDHEPVELPFVVARDGEFAPIALPPLVPRRSLSVQPQTKPARDSPPRSSLMTNLRTAGWLSAGTGVVVLSVGAILAINAKNDWEDSRAHCDSNNVCTRTGYDLAQGARSAGNWATAATVAGSVLTGVGVGLVLWTSAQANSARARASISGTGVRLSFEERF